MPAAEFVLWTSATRSKIALSSRHRLGRVFHLPTKELTRNRCQPAGQARRKTLGSRVGSPRPQCARREDSSPPICWVSHKIILGVGIDYPRPETIGADRLANATPRRRSVALQLLSLILDAAVTSMSSRWRATMPAVSSARLGAMTDYCNRTALLPRVSLREPRQAIGRSTAEAMRSGAIHGYRGLIAEIVRQILKEIPSKSRTHLIATGGDAKLIAELPAFFRRFTIPHP